MKILSIDASCKSSSVCVIEDDKLLCELNLDLNKTQSRVILYIIDLSLKLSGIKISEIDKIICVNGPGSFTGLRILLSTVKGLAHSMNIPIYAVDTITSIGMYFSNREELIAVIIDARNRNVYCGLFYDNKQILETSMMSFYEFLEKIEEIKCDKKVYFVGNAVNIFEKDILQNKNYKICSEDNTINSAYFAYYAYKNNFAKEYNYDNLKVNYLKKAQAEIDLKNGNLKVTENKNDL